MHQRTVFAAARFSHTLLQQTCRSAYDAASMSCKVNRQSLSNLVGGVMRLTQAHEQYWRKNLLVTGQLLAIWFVVTFVGAWYARELNGISMFGFPLGFYGAAQGSLLVYVLLIWFYQHYMHKLDIEYGVDESDDL